MKQCIDVSVFLLIVIWQTALTSAQFNAPPSIPVGFRRFFQVNEGDPVGTVLFTLLAKDTDSNDVLQFSAVERTETETLVRLGTPVKQDSDIWACELTLNQPLDRDRNPGTRRLYFTISDGRSQVQVILTMIINDVNDNPPSFVNLPYKTSIPEDFGVGVSFYSVSATDPDMNSGGSVSYSIEANRLADVQEYRELFSIQQYLGDIQLKKQLDYEDRSFYHLKVSATDLGDPPCPGVTCLCNSSEAVCDAEPVDFFITVEDVQDTPPVFERLFDMYSVPENSPVGFSILQVEATDGDRGVAEPNKVQYSISNSNAIPFTIDPVEGTIIVAETLDASDTRSRGGLYILSVTATEVPPPNSSADPDTLSTQTNVSIIVTDVDDHAPTFNQATYTASVLENTPSGAPLSVSPNIVVTDLDQGENSRFRVSVQKDGIPYNGFTTLPGEEQIIQGSSSVTVTVGDSTVLDYETSHSISFQLILIEEHPDGNAPFPQRPTSTATVVLELRDANDNSPVFLANQNDSFTIDENASVGHVIGTMTAEDADSENFGNITFSLEEDGHDSEFTISSQGVITLAKKLDREIRSSYSLVVMATDSPDSPASKQRTSRFPIRVLVNDVNDMRPQWTQVIPVVSVQESAGIGTKITDLIAIDGDQGMNGVITYSIAPGTNGSSLFSVQKVDGRAEVYVGSSLIGHSGLQLVRVIATDNGTEPQSSEAEVTVVVIDENQFDPVFINPDETQYNVTTGELPEIPIDEELAINTVLMTLRATDRDQGLNGEINYFLVPSLNKDFEYFTVDRESGFLRAARKLDREVKAEYEIQVKAEDLGKPAARASTITMRVVLRDIDDHIPTFAGQVMPLAMSVPEEDPTAEIGVVEASDADSDPSNRGVCYYLYGGDFLPYLSLNKSTGDLSLKQSVDRESTQFFDVVIKASPRCDLDLMAFVSKENASAGSNTSVSSESSAFPASYNASDASLLWVRVTVRDENDSPPVFTHEALSTGVLFDVPRDTEVMDLTIHVTDDDSSANSRHMYRLLNVRPELEEGGQLSDSSQPAFTVSANGTVATNTLFSSDLLGYFLLSVQVYDSDGLSDTANVRVYLISNLQRVKLIFNMRPNEVEVLKQDFVNQLSEILKVNLVMDRVVSHTAVDGSKDASKSDAYLHGWYQDTGEMVPAAELRRNLDFNQEVRALLYRYDVVEAQTIEKVSTDDDSEELTRLFSIIIAVLGVFVIVLILVLVHMVRMYRRRLRAATTMAYAAPKEQEMYEHPGTNKYYSAENPLYGREIKQAVIDDDKTSHNSLDVNAVDVSQSAHILPPGQKLSAPLPEPPLPPPPPPHEEQEMVLQISDSVLDAPKPAEPFSNSNGTTLSGGSVTGSARGDNHIATLDQVLQAYSNSAFEDDEDQNTESLNASNRNGNGVKSNAEQSDPVNVKNNRKHQKPSRRISSSASSKGSGSARPAAAGEGVGLYIPGVGENVQEGVTRFSDDVLSSDSGYPDGIRATGSHLDYTDI